jgi:hypothetical protein
VAKQPSHPIDLVRLRGVLTPLENRRPWNRERALSDDPKRLAGSVVVRRPDIHLGLQTLTAVKENVPNQGLWGNEICGTDHTATA